MTPAKPTIPSVFKASTGNTCKQRNQQEVRLHLWGSLYKLIASSSWHWLLPKWDVLQRERFPSRDLKLEVLWPKGTGHFGTLVSQPVLLLFFWLVKDTEKKLASVCSLLFHLAVNWHGVCCMKMMCVFHVVLTARRCWCSPAAISHLCLLVAGGKERNNVPVRLLKQVTWKTAVYPVQGGKMIIHQSWTKKTCTAPRWTQGSCVRLHVK